MYASPSGHLALRITHPHLLSTAIGIFQPPDVRPIIKAYEGKNIPIEYAQREAERKQAAIEEWEREHGGALVGAGAGSSWLSKAFSGLGGVSSCFSVLFQPR
jgi:import inner membrane translocase subunit TIM50